MNQSYDDPVAEYLLERDRAARRSKGTINLLLGIFFILLGVVITIATYDHATSHGGRYLLAWGPVVFGSTRMLRGLIQLGGA